MRRLCPHPPPRHLGLALYTALAALLAGCGSSSGSPAAAITRTHQAATPADVGSSADVPSRPCGELTDAVAGEVLEHKAEVELGNGARAATNCIYYYELPTPITREGGGLMTNATLELEWAPGEGSLALQEYRESPSAGWSRHTVSALGPGAFVQIHHQSTITAVAAYADVGGTLLKLTAEAPTVNLGRLEAAFQRVATRG